jgi:hypothetical protein
MKSEYKTDTWIPVFTEALFTLAKLQSQSKRLKNMVYMQSGMATWGHIYIMNWVPRLQDCGSILQKAVVALHYPIHYVASFIARVQNSRNGDRGNVYVDQNITSCIFRDIWSLKSKKLISTFCVTVNTLRLNSQRINTWEWECEGYCRWELSDKASLQ